MEVKVRVFTSRVGNSSITWEYRFHSADGALLARSSNTVVAVDMDTLKPLRLPDDLREAFASCREDGGEHPRRPARPA
jgi:acyl-CoA thioesterase FadM